MKLPMLISRLNLKAGYLLQVPPGRTERWTEQLVDFYEGVLRSGLVLPSSGGLAEGMRQPSVSTEVYANILTGTVFDSPLHHCSGILQSPEALQGCGSVFTCCHARVACLVCL